MPQTSKMKPVLLIVTAILLAGGIALYMSRQGSAESADNSGQAAKTASSGAAAAPAGGGHVRGAADAPVTLLEFGDYQCPTCGLYHPITNELLARFNGKLKLEFHHFPLITAHPNAMNAALAAEAAAEQGKFWEMHDMLFKNQNVWAPNRGAPTLFVQYALQIGIDSNKFMQAMRSPDTQARVLDDVRRGNDVVKGTPTFLINGVLVPGLPDLEGLSDRIKAQLQALGK